MAKLSRSKKYPSRPIAVVSGSRNVKKIKNQNVKVKIVEPLRGGKINKKDGRTV